MKGNSSHAQSTRIAAAASSSGLSKQAVANAKQAYAIHAKNLTGSLQASVDTLAGDDEEWLPENGMWIFSQNSWIIEYIIEIDYRSLN